MDIATTVMGIYIIQNNGHEEPEDVRVMIEGINVISNVGSIIMGFIMVFGLIYALDLAFPKTHKYTFDSFPEDYHELRWTQA